MKPGVYPKLEGSGELAVCFSIYDWLNPVTTSWLQEFEKVFSLFGETPVEATAHFQGRKTHGSFGRVRRKLEEFIREGQDLCTLDVRLNGTKTHPDEGHFPSSIVVAASSESKASRKLIVAIRKEVCASTDELFEKAGNDLLANAGSCYGATFEFPAIFGPASYLASVHTIPKGASVTANQDYADRLTRWRKRIMSGRFSMRAGFFREIYEDNLLTENHLDRTFEGGRLAEYMKKVGVVNVVARPSGLYRWRIPNSKLDSVRDRLEKSGYVLSSKTNPVEPDIES